MRPTRGNLLRFFPCSDMDRPSPLLRLNGRWLFVSLLLILALPLRATPTPSSCSDRERNALLRLKVGFGDPDGRLYSWRGLDCCQWRGVTCDNATGAVVKLELQLVYSFDRQGNAEDNGVLTGKLDPSLLQLKSLTYLDLSGNSLDGDPIPAWLGSLRRLEHLDLSQAGFAGAVPHQLGNLAALRYLGISYVTYDDDDGNAPRLHVESFNWISRLSSLRYLSMGGVDLSRISSAEIIQTLNDNLPSLADLHLEYCRISGIPQSVPSLKFPVLKTLDLSSNNLGPSVPPWIFNVTSLEDLNLGDCGFQGLVPSGFGDLLNLDKLILSENKFSGSFPTSIGKLCKISILYLDGNNLNSELPQRLDRSSNASCGPLSNLAELDLSRNKIPGHLPRWVEDLDNLKYVALESNMIAGDLPLGKGWMTVLMSDNQLVAELSEARLAGLKDLLNLDVGNNREISVNLRPEWVPPFQLSSLRLRGCRVGPRFPSWIKNQKDLEELDLSNAGIADTIPAWFWGLSPSLKEVNLSSNLITGSISEDISAWKSLTSLDLSSNRFSGSIPASMAAMSLNFLDLSNNNLSGQVPGPPIFNMSTLHGNPLLCGPPTNAICPRDQREGGAAVRRFDIARNASFYLGAAGGAAAGVLITLAIWTYLGRFRERNKVDGKMIPMYSDDLTKDGGGVK